MADTSGDTLGERSSVGKERWDQMGRFPTLSSKVGDLLPPSSHTVCWAVRRSACATRGGSVRASSSRGAKQGVLP